MNPHLQILPKQFYQLGANIQIYDPVEAVLSQTTTCIQSRVDPVNQACAWGTASSFVDGKLTHGQGGLLWGAICRQTLLKRGFGRVPSGCDHQLESPH